MQYDAIKAGARLRGCTVTDLSALAPTFDTRRNRRPGMEASCSWIGPH